ncbi:hypothetical protein [Collinsella ihumii]|uniref:hypothetical protein n=1 Tax=Collinsella ihumii TaxID=1720204 RepID=UPI0025AB245D|nr:hypothetical protein [Collinsella ihumii]MDN0055557.1 hypothetical protein [Collinsella ihumii]
MNTSGYKAYIEDYLSNCGQDVREWDTEAMAEDLSGRLHGESPDGMDPDDFTQFLQSWDGVVADA